MIEIAYAKINLALHVRDRLPNGYHRIETLFAFCEDGDRLTLEPREAGVSLTVGGPFARELSGEVDNLVLAAEAIVGSARPSGSAGAALHLDKRLPVAAGLGGGSADAGAAIRLLARHWGLAASADAIRDRAAMRGADIPACIASRICIGTGTGADLLPAPRNDASGLAVLLVNPGERLETGPVFNQWNRTDQGGLASGSVLEAALAGRNDLEPAAITLRPAIACVLDALRYTSPILARMSGSGATCFALFEDDAARDAAAAAITVARPDWWQLRSRLR